MKKNGAIWVALVVVAVAALLMYFVVLPQLRADKAGDELARKASETVEQAKDTTQKTLDKAEDGVQTAADQTKDAVNDATASPKAGVLAKMARVKADGEAATVEFQELFADNKQPTVEQVIAARAKLEAALKGASEVTAPEGLDAATAALIAKTSEGARNALTLLQAMPTDAKGAKAAYDALKATFVAALSGSESPKVATESTSNDAAKAADTRPADSVTKPAGAADATLPGFDVLRVEKDGSTVIAGHAAPNAKIDIVDGGTAIASTESGDTGDFVAVLDNPLVAGDHQLVIRQTGKDGKPSVSVEVATVSVPADKSGELLAMVTKPGEASRIMTMPEAKDTIVANNTGKNGDVATDVNKAATVVADAAQPVEAAKSVEAGTADNSAATPKLPDASSDAVVAVEKQAAAADAARPADATQVAKSDAATETASNATTEVAKAETSEASPVSTDARPAEKSLAAPEVLVSAVEIEGSKIFVAGAARPKAVVRVYADDKLVAEVSSDENGRFVADSTMPLTVGKHTIRADVLSSDGKKVEFRASVPFFRPEGEQLAAVAGDNATTSKQEMQPLADGDYDKAREEAGKAVSLLKGLYDAGRTPTLDELAAARSATEIALKTLSQIKLADNDDPVARKMADKTAGKAAQALALLKSLPQDANAVKTALASIDDAVTSAVAPAIDIAAASKPTVATVKEQASDDTTIVDKAAADQPVVLPQATEADRSGQVLARQGTEVASADSSQPKVIEQAPLKPSQSSVIIRRGDTLWQISRRVYGRGVRYTTIYVANEDQITNPDRIMPGQIFGVPDKFLPNSEELHRERMDHKKH
jgi:nucleoid-associated protein YgaU